MVDRSCIPLRVGAFRRHGVHPASFGWQTSGGFAALLALLTFVPAHAADDAPAVPVAAPRVGFLVHIELPLTSGNKDRVQRMIERLVDKAPPGGPRPYLILEFLPTDLAAHGAGSEFESALSLARLLTSPELNKVETVAFIPHSIQGHALLVAMACERIVMARDASLIDAGADEPVLDASVRSAYEDIAGRRNTIPKAVALALLDKRLRLYWVKAPQVKFVLDAEFEELKQQGAATDSETVKTAGEPAKLAGKDLRELYRFVSNLADDRRELEWQLKLPSGSIEVDPTLGDDVRAIQVNLIGSMASMNWVQRAIEDGMRDHNANLVVIQIDSKGGSVLQSLQIAAFLAALDDNTVRTVAWIPNEAASDAALVALACDHVVLGKGARLGGPGAGVLYDSERDSARTAIQSFAARNSRHWSLAAATIDDSEPVFAYRHVDTGLVEYFRPAEHEAQPDPSLWKQEGELVKKGEILSVTGDKAVELGLARYTAEGFEQFKQLYQIDRDPVLVQPNWAHRLVEGLAHPAVAIILVFVGGFALIVEAKSPGIGVGAFTAGVCFLLFFWGQILQGNADYLEVMMFVAGVICVALEIFVLPGFGIFGLGGGALIIFSLILASQTFILPRNAYELSQVPYSLFTVVSTGAGILASFYVMSRIIPHTPYLNKLVLKPPGEEIARREALANFDDLVGQEGTTSSQLTPSGFARFGAREVPVLCQGEVIPKGERVRVVEVLGNRVVVELVLPAKPSR